MVEAALAAMGSHAQCEASLPQAGAEHAAHSSTGSVADAVVHHDAQQLLRRGSLAGHLQVLPPQAPAPPPLLHGQRAHATVAQQIRELLLQPDHRIVRALKATFDALLAAAAASGEEAEALHPAAKSGEPGTTGQERGVSLAPWHESAIPGSRAHAAAAPSSTSDVVPAACAQGSTLAGVEQEAAEQAAAVQGAASPDGTARVFAPGTLLTEMFYTGKEDDMCAAVQGMGAADAAQEGSVIASPAQQPGQLFAFTWPAYGSRTPSGLQTDVEPFSAASVEAKVRRFEAAVAAVAAAAPSPAPLPCAAPAVPAEPQGLLPHSATAQQVAQATLLPAELAGHMPDPAHNLDQAASCAGGEFQQQACTVARDLAARFQQVADEEAAGVRLPSAVLLPGAQNTPVQTGLVPGSQTGLALGAHTDAASLGDGSWGTGSPSLLGNSPPAPTCTPLVDVRAQAVCSVLQELERAAHVLRARLMDQQQQIGAGLRAGPQQAQPPGPQPTLQQQDWLVPQGHVQQARVEPAPYAACGVDPAATMQVLVTSPAVPAAPPVTPATKPGPVKSAGMQQHDAAQQEVQTAAVPAATQGSVGSSPPAVSPAAATLGSTGSSPESLGPVAKVSPAGLGQKLQLQRQHTPAAASPRAATSPMAAAIAASRHAMMDRVDGLRASLANLSGCVHVCAAPGASCGGPDTAGKHMNLSIIGGYMPACLTVHDWLART